jgi:hypothetical protein
MVSRKTMTKYYYTPFYPNITEVYFSERQHKFYCVQRFDAVIDASDEANASKSTYIKTNLGLDGHFLDKKNLTGVQRKLTRATRPLNRVQPNDLLVINAHGQFNIDKIAVAYVGRGYVGETRTSDGDSVKAQIGFTSAELAKRLEKDGLKKEHRVIRLLACEAGGAIDPDSFSGGSPTESYPKISERSYSYKEGEPFARRLAVALGVIGYRCIIVGGYPGEVGITGGLNAPFKGQGVIWKRTGSCRYFNGRGEEVGNPRNPEKAQAQGFSA